MTVTTSTVLATALDPVLRQVVEDFDAAFGDLCRQPEWARERCAEVSDRFAEKATAAGFPAKSISGIQMGEIPQFPGVTLMLHGHFAALVATRFDEQASDGQGEWTDEVVFDWTARQFDPDADVPLVVDLDEWRETWRDISRGGQ